MNIEIKILGSGTQQEVVQSLLSMSRMVEALTNDEIEAGQDLEDEILTCQVDKLYI